MKNDYSIQEEMYREMRTKGLFDKAHSYSDEYLDNVFERTVYPTDDAILNLTRFEEDLPAEPQSAMDVLDLLNRYGAPATVAQLGGRYFGFVCGSAVPAGLAAKSLATFWDQNPAMYVLSPVASTLESVVERWLKRLFGLPERTVAGFVNGTSSANLCGLAAARYRLLKNSGWDIHAKGLFQAPHIRIVTGSQVHATVLRALGVLGFGRDQIDLVDVDSQGRILPRKIPDLDERTIVVLQAGNVNSGSFDPFLEICGKAHQAQAWVHIDGAFGLWVAAVDKLKHLTQGVEKADSWALDGHKTLNAPYDCGIVLCEDRDALVSALHMTANYIVVSDRQRDGMFFTPDMSRRARIVELWATLRYLGREGINQMVYGMHQRAAQFADELRRIGGFEVLNDVVFNQVLVQCETDELTIKTLQRIQELRECWVGGSSWNGRTVIRISVCSWATTPDDVRRSVLSFKHALHEAKGNITSADRRS